MTGRLGCPICLNAHDEQDPKWVVISSCGHIFHTDCLQAWIARNKRCPQCRGAVDSRVVKPIYPNFDEAQGGSPSQRPPRPPQQVGGDNVQIVADEQLVRENRQLQMDLEFAAKNIYDLQTENTALIRDLDAARQSADAYARAYQGQVEVNKRETAKLKEARAEAADLRRQKTYVEGELRVLQSREMAHRIHTDDSVTEQELINMGMPEADKVRAMARRVVDLNTRVRDLNTEVSRLTGRVNSLTESKAMEVQARDAEVARLRKLLADVEAQAAAQERRDASLGPGNAPGTSSAAVTAVEAPVPQQVQSRRPPPVQAMTAAAALLSRAPRAPPSLAAAALTSRERAAATAQSVRLKKGTRLSLTEPDFGVRASGLGVLKARDVNAPAPPQDQQGGPAWKRPRTYEGNIGTLVGGAQAENEAVMNMLLNSIPEAHPAPPQHTRQPTAGGAKPPSSAATAVHQQQSNGKRKQPQAAQNPGIRSFMTAQAQAPPSSNIPTTTGTRRQPGAPTTRPPPTARQQPVRIDDDSDDDIEIVDEGAQPQVPAQDDGLELWDEEEEAGVGQFGQFEADLVAPQGVRQHPDDMLERILLEL